MRKIINTAICLLLVLAMTVPAFADTSQGTATTLKLEKTEGKVNITKSAGKSVTVKDGIRLYDGYTVKTDKNSKAYVSLDQSKAIMLDASTTCSIKKSGKKLEIMLQSGTVLVNVEDKLAGDEELNIRTTNSVTGIRGTIAQFTFNSTTQNTEVYLFEGRTTGTYLAPDGSWYTQELVSGSWLASGKGMLADHPQYNGWTLQEDGSWLYTNNNINSPANASYFWGKGTGWFMKDAMTGETDTRTAWPFTFPMLEPAVQKEIINDESMLKRGQEHLDLYPELAEKKLEDTKKAADESLIAKTEEAEKRDEAIQELYDKGTASVDNLFKDTAPSVPTYAVRYYKNNDLTELLQTRYFEEGEAVDQPTDLIKGYTITGWSMQDPDSGTDIPVTTMGTVVIDCWPAGVTANLYRITLDENAAEATVDGPNPVEGDYDFLMGTSLPNVINPDDPDNIFVGWSTSATATKPEFTTTKTVDEIIQTVDPGKFTQAIDGTYELDLYAVWGRLITVTFYHAPMESICIASTDLDLNGRITNDEEFSTIELTAAEYATAKFFAYTPDESEPMPSDKYVFYSDGVSVALGADNNLTIVPGDVDIAYAVEYKDRITVTFNYAAAIASDIKIKSSHEYVDAAINHMTDSATVSLPTNIGEVLFYAVNTDEEATEAIFYLNGSATPESLDGVYLTVRTDGGDLTYTVDMP